MLAPKRTDRGFVVDVLLAGLIAGWAIAIPVGAMGVMVVDRAVRLGFGAGAVAGTGTALADGLYATLGVVTGPAAVNALAPARDGIELTGGIVLVGIGMWMGHAARRAGRDGGSTPTRSHTRPSTSGAGRGTDPWRAGLGFFVLTLANPMTIVYFTGVVVSGLVPSGPAARLVLFPIGALLASASWQWLLAGLGALGGNRLAALGRWTRWAGAVAVAGLGLRAVVVALP